MSGKTFMHKVASVSNIAKIVSSDYTMTLAQMVGMDEEGSPVAYISMDWDLYQKGPCTMPPSCSDNSWGMSQARGTTPTPSPASADPVHWVARNEKPRGHHNPWATN